MQVSADQLAKLEQTLLSQQEPLHNRFRALFTLKAVGGSEAIRIVAEGATLGLAHEQQPALWRGAFDHEQRADQVLCAPCPGFSAGFKDPSALLKHEFAYVLGQLKLVEACPILSAVLENASEDPMVRHEVRLAHLHPGAMRGGGSSARALAGPAAAPLLPRMRTAHCRALVLTLVLLPLDSLDRSLARSQAAEALGAIGDKDSLPVLHKYLDDAHVEVRETCEIAIAKIEYDNSPEGLEEARLSKDNGSVCAWLFLRLSARVDPADSRPASSPSDLAAGLSLRSTPRRATTSLRPRPWPTLRAGRPSCRRRQSPNSRRPSSTARSRSSPATALCSRSATSRRRKRRSSPSLRASRTRARCSGTKLPTSLAS